MAARAGNGALDMVLERLQRVEEQLTANSFPASSSPSRRAREVAATPTTEASGPSLSSKACETWVPSTVGSSCIADPVPMSSDNPSLPSLQPNSASPILVAPGNLDVGSILSEAVARIQELKGFHNTNMDVFVTEGISIPPGLARTWIHNYFTYMPAELFLSLVDRKLIEMIPDLLHMRHIKLDACMLLVYYAILYHGCFLPGKRSYGSPDKKYARQLYICCLRTIHIWQREATGTVTDFIAAIYMTRTSAECFDFDLSWEMHKLACEYAQGLQMHSLDDKHNLLTVGSANPDDDRKGMWELIQMDLFYRLIYNKPAAFSLDLAGWRVNLPWLTLDTFPDKEAAVPTMKFIVSSRLTFVLIAFFQMFDKLETGSVALEAIEPLCQEIEDLMEEWGIEDWIRSFRHDEVYTWILTDLALTGYTCIIFMLRKVTLGSDSPKSLSLDANIPQTDLARKASRQILGLIHYMLHGANLPKPEALSSILGTHRAYVAYAYLATSVIDSPTPGTMAEDMELLERVTRSVEMVALEENDFVPFARALKYVNAGAGGMHS